MNLFWLLDPPDRAAMAHANASLNMSSCVERLHAAAPLKRGGSPRVRRHSRWSSVRPTRSLVARSLAVLSLCSPHLESICTHADHNCDSAHHTNRLRSDHHRLAALAAHGRQHTRTTTNAACTPDLPSSSPSTVRLVNQYPRGCCSAARGSQNSVYV